MVSRSNLTAADGGARPDRSGGAPFRQQALHSLPTGER